MIKLIFPLFFILGSILVISILIFPAWQRFITIRADTAYLQNLNRELDKLIQKRDEITDQISNISQENFQRLDQILPASAQGPEFLVILQDKALVRGLKLNKLDLSGNISTEPRVASETTAVISAQGFAGSNATPGQVQAAPYRTVKAVIDIAGPYDSFKQFLRDIESYIRITDIEALTIGSSATGFTYRVSVQTHYK